MMVDEAEKQIRARRKDIDYNTHDYTIDFIVEKFKGNKFYIPVNDYQRNYVWKDVDKTRFIESTLLGLPIPFMFFSKTEDGRLEIVDGAQRTKTLVSFIDNDFKLTNLRKLPALNDFYYNDLPKYFKNRFDDTTMRIIGNSSAYILTKKHDVLAIFVVSEQI